MSLSEDLATWQWENGLAHKPSHLIEKEERAEIPAQEWEELAWATLRQDYGEGYAKDDVMRAAQSVVAEWHADGRQLQSNRRDAYALAAAVGGRLYDGGAPDPAERGRKSKATGLFGREIEDAQDPAKR